MSDTNNLKEKYPITQSQSTPVATLSKNSINLNNSQWYVIENRAKFRRRVKNEPASRWGHTAIIKDNKMLIYGGSGLGPKNAKHWQCFYELDLLTWEWTKLKPENNLPSARDSHTAVLIENDVYIFGGSGSTIKQNDEFHKFNINTRSWKRIAAEGTQPRGRESHTATVLYGKYMVIYGGLESHQDAVTNTYVYDLEKQKWSLVIRKAGPRPKPRDSHGACCIQDYVYIFGGQGNDEQLDDDERHYEVYFNDLFRFKIEVDGGNFYSVWEELKPFGPKPSKRASLSTCAYKDRYLFVIGGEGYPKDFDEESLFESDPKKQYDILLKHRRNENGEILSFPKSDVWYYDTELNIWNELKIKNSDSFPPSFAHTACVFEDYIIIFGGLSNDYTEPIDDMFVLALDGADSLKLKSDDAAGNII